MRRRRRARSRPKWMAAARRKIAPPAGDAPIAKSPPKTGALSKRYIDISGAASPFIQNVPLRLTPGEDEQNSAAQGLGSSAAAEGLPRCRAPIQDSKLAARGAQEIVPLHFLHGQPGEQYQPPARATGQAQADCHPEGNTPFSSSKCSSHTPIAFPGGSHAVPQNAGGGRVVGRQAPLLTRQPFGDGADVQQAPAARPRPFSLPRLARPGPPLPALPCPPAEDPVGARPQVPPRSRL